MASSERSVGFGRTSNASFVLVFLSTSKVEKAFLEQAPEVFLLLSRDEGVTATTILVVAEGRAGAAATAVYAKKE